MKCWLLAALLCLASSGALAQGCGPTNPNCVVPDRPPGDSTNSAANTRFVLQNAGGGGSLPNGNIGGVPFYNTTTSVVSSPALAANALVIGGGAVGPSTLAGLGAIGQTLISAGNSSPPAFGTLGVAGGGTGISSASIGSMLYYNTSASLAQIPAGSSGQVLTSNGASSAPTWQTGGGGGIPTGTVGGVPYYNTTTTVQSSGALTNNAVVIGGTAGPTVVSSLGTTGQVLTSNGAGAAPTWQTSSGGTVGPQNANTFFAGPLSGAAATPTFRLLNTADVDAGFGTTVGTALMRTPSGWVPTLPSDQINLSRQYGVVCDNATDNSTAISNAIAAVNTAGGNVTILFPKGICKAPTLAASITTNSVFLNCDGGPGDCILSGGTNNMLSWTSTHYGGAVNMGFDNTGAATNNSLVVNCFSCQFIRPFIGQGVGTFLTMNDATHASTNVVDGATGGGNNQAGSALFLVVAGNGLIVRNSQLNSTGPTAAAGRDFVRLSGASVDTVVIQNNVMQLYDTCFNVQVNNGSISGNYFMNGNVCDGTQTSYAVFNVDSGGTLYSVHLQDKWVTSKAGPAISFTGAGVVDSVVINSRIVGSGTNGIISTVTGTFKNILIDGVLGTGINLTSTAGTSALSLAGGAGYSNIQITNNSLGLLSGQAGVVQPTNGCIVLGLIDHMTFLNNNCEGTTTNYNGMLAGTGTVFSHTNWIQSNNIGLLDDDGPWTAYTPTITCGSGTITTLGAVSGRYKRFRRTVVVSMSISITAIGSCAGSVNASLPYTAVSTVVLPGRDGIVGGAMLQGLIGATNTVNWLKYDNTFAFANNSLILGGGAYESVQ